MLLPPCCPICGDLGAAPCRRCADGILAAPGLPVPDGLDGCHALLAYDAAARDLVTALKFRNRRDALGWLADGMARLVRPGPGVVVTWAPTSLDRRRARGFDQAELLARAVARRWSVPVRRTLRRRHGPHQTGRTAVDRRRHPGFHAVAPAPQELVVVDDVATTGATLRAAASTLRVAGARSVVGLVAARTAAPGGS